MGSRRRVQAEGENVHKGSIMHSLVNHARALRFYSEAKRLMRSYFLFFFFFYKAISLAILRTMCHREKTGSKEARH